MANEQGAGPVQPETTSPAFSVSVRPNLDGGWLTVVHLGDGASLTKWFASQDEANRYPDELAKWLAQGRE